MQLTETGTNAFTSSGEWMKQVNRQVVGIPMGGHASSDIANLYCYRIESKFMDDLVAKGELGLARKHDYSCRYIDDFLTWNCNPPPAE